MQIHCRISLVAATVILLASCSKTNTQGKYIPSDASFVLQVNGKSLSSKLPWDEVKQNPLFKDANIDSTVPSGMKMLLNNPDSVGIDAGADLIFFVEKDSIGGYVALEGSIKNEELFKTFNKQVTENGTESEKDGVNFISKSPLCVGYSKDKFVYVYDAPQIKQIGSFTKGMGQNTNDVVPGRTRDIGGTCKAIFALNESNTLAKNERFGKLMGESGDIHLWINGEELLKGAPGNPMMAMVDMDKFYKGTVTTASVNFNNGKIIMDAKSYVSDDVAKIYKKYTGGKISEEMIKRMPGKDVDGLMAINFNPEVIREVLKIAGLDGVANSGMSRVGFTMDDVIKAFKGDVFFGVSDFAMKTDTSNGAMYTGEKPVFNFVFATSIGDKDAFNKVINAGKKQMGDTADFPFAYNSNGTYFAVANSKENADKYLASTNTNFDFISKINGQAFGGYLNIQSLMKAFAGEATKDSSGKAALDASMKFWDNISMKGGDMSSDAITQTVEINLVDKTTNSLKQLNQYASKLSEIYKATKEKQKADMMAYEDSMPPKKAAPPAKTK